MTTAWNLAIVVYWQRNLDKQADEYENKVLIHLNFVRKSWSLQFGLQSL